jgi:hypothetical protein
MQKAEGVAAFTLKMEAVYPTENFGGIILGYMTLHPRRW